MSEPEAFLLHCLPILPASRSAQARERMQQAFSHIQKAVADLTCQGGEAVLEPEHVWIIVLLFSLTGMREETELLIERYCISEWAFHTDAKIISATNRDLEERSIAAASAVWKRRFRQGH